MKTQIQHNLTRHTPLDIKHYIGTSGMLNALESIDPEDISDEMLSELWRTAKKSVDELDKYLYSESYDSLIKSCFTRK